MRGLKGKLLLLVLLPWALQMSAQGRNPRVAVKTFTNPPAYANSTIGSSLTDMVITELRNGGKFTLIEREDIQDIMKELDFSSSEYSNKASFSQKGKLLGAQYILVGKVSNFSFIEHATQKEQFNLLGPNQIVTVYDQEAVVRVDFRLIDTATGEDVIAQKGEGRVANYSSARSENYLWGLVQRGEAFGTAEFSSSMIGRATEAAVSDVVHKLNALSAEVKEASQTSNIEEQMQKLSAPGQILGGDGAGGWIVSLGSSIGLQKGDHLLVAAEKVLKDKSGRVIYKEHTYVGALEVLEVGMPDAAKARVVGAPAQEIQEGYTVKVDLDYARKLRGGAPGLTSSARVPGSAGAPASGEQLRQLLRQGDNYFDDGNYSEALGKYSQAAQLKPNDPGIMADQGKSHLMLRDFLEAEDLDRKALAAGHAIVVPVGHEHYSGFCLGNLSIAPGSLSYESPHSKDDFKLTRADIVSLAVVPWEHKGFAVSHEMRSGVPPVLYLDWRDSKNHEKKYVLLPTALLRMKTTGRYLDDAFDPNPSDLKDTEKLENLIVKLVEEFVK